MCILYILKIASQKVSIDCMMETCQTWSWVGKSLLFEDNLRRVLDLELEDRGLGPGSFSY